MLFVVNYDTIVVSETYLQHVVWILQVDYEVVRYVVFIGMETQLNPCNHASLERRLFHQICGIFY